MSSHSVSSESEDEVTVKEELEEFLANYLSSASKRVLSSDKKPRFRENKFRSVMVSSIEPPILIQCSNLFGYFKI